MYYRPIYALRAELKIALHFISSMPHCSCGGQRTTAAMGSFLLPCGYRAQRAQQQAVHLPMDSLCPSYSRATFKEGLGM